MIVYANGCSWTAGDGLDRDPAFSGMPIADRSKLWKNLSWPARLATKLNGSFINDAIGGGSNQRMVRLTTDFVRKWPRGRRHELLVVLGWTSCERGEVHVSYGGVSRWCQFNAWQEFGNQWDQRENSKDAAPWPDDVVKKISNYQKTHVQYMVDEMECTRRFLREIWTMANMLENLGIKYLFFSSIQGFGFPGSTINPHETFRDDMEYLKQEQFTGIGNGHTMMKHCHDLGLPLSPCHHPMIAAHESWAAHLHNQYMRIYQDDHNTKDSQQALGRGAMDQ